MELLLYLHSLVSFYTATCMGDKMIVIICGSRGFDHYETVKRYLDQLFVNQKPDEIIHGDCKGSADMCAKRYANENNIKCTAYPADWNRHGKSAGPIRNKQMITEGKATHCIGFNLGTNGTTGMLQLAKDAGLIIREIKIAMAA